MAGFKLGSMGHWKVSKDKHATLTNHWFGKEILPNCLHGKNLGMTIMTSAKEADVYIMSYTCHLPYKKTYKNHSETHGFPLCFVFCGGLASFGPKMLTWSCSWFSLLGWRPGEKSPRAAQLVGLYVQYVGPWRIAKLVSNSKNWISFMIFYEYVWNFLL